MGGNYSNVPRCVRLTIEHRMCVAGVDLPPEFRLAVPADAERLTRYHHAAWLFGLHHLFPPGALTNSDPLEKLDRWHSWLADGSGYTTVVAEQQGIAVGHTTVAGDELVHLFIDPSWSGLGLGRRLLGVGEAMLAGAGHETARLNTLEGNDRAISLYTRNGWQMTKMLTPGIYFGHERNEHTLTKRLSDRSASC